MNILLLGFLALAAAASYEGFQRGGTGRDQRGMRRRLNSTARHNLEENLHVNLTARGDRLKRMQDRMQNKMNRKASSPRRMQKQQKEQEEVEKKIAEIPQITPEKPAGVETVNLFERNDLEGTSEYMFQGDMHFTDEQLDVMESHLDDDDSDDDNNSTRRKRQASTVFRKWTGNTVYYYFDAALSTRVRNSVTAAHALITQNTCVNFVQSPTAANRVKVFPGNGCFSNVGMSGGEQSLSLGTGCEVIGTAVHEFSHALGIYHTQMRSDRDSFVTINQAAIQPQNFAANFPKLTASESTNYVPYEYGSDMHYPANAFAINSNTLAMVARDTQYTNTMGGSLTTFYDLKNINDHYGCTAQCASSSTRCQNGGVPNPRQNCATCICPAGYAGNLCDQRPPGCGETLTATADWQTKQFSFGDQNNNKDTRDVFTMCNHWITAPAGQRIVVKITSSFNTQCNYGCPFNGIEIKTQSQQATNPRICCDASLNQEFTSNLNPTPIVSFNRYYYTTFTIQYKTVSGAPSPDPVPAPGPSPLANCQDDANCAGWIAQGFCTNNFYTIDQRKQYCPKACNLCTAATCVDTNASCPGFVANGFCTNSFYTVDYRQATCAKSCNLC